ncbi:DUF1015 domain-containing protein [candidate division KSB1 bacterium]|nr:DUF1015 domain-containing protein [candidate division KSB1 bacterium]RQW01323.1 MAG: DUF1015 domain-containing protein [candidate division KSB1 bacterium]
MATILPFRALCPNPTLVDKIAALPYDVLSTKEARDIAANNPHCFLFITKPEIDFTDDVNHYSETVYARGAKNLQRFIREYKLLQEKEPYYYLYQQIMGDHVQTGFVGIASVDEYDRGIIKKHEYTRPEKVNDRVHLMSRLKAQTGPVFLAYRQNDKMAALVSMLLSKSRKIYDFISFYDVRHIFYKVDHPPFNEIIRSSFAELPTLYIADGHHRSESAAVLCRQKRQEQPNFTGEESYNFFLTVTFPHTDLLVLPYNRVVRDLNGYTAQTLLEKLKEKFVLTPITEHFESLISSKTFAMYMNKQWFKLAIKKEYVHTTDAVKSLDVSILQDNILHPLLGIENPRMDERIDFIGGIRGVRELERLVGSGVYAVAFALFPTSMQQVMDVADAGTVMPPKSTWFEPKLLSGLATHLLD